MQKYFINGRFLTRPVTGVERYAYEFTTGLDKLLLSGQIDRSRHFITILAPNEPLKEIRLKNIRIEQVGYLRGNLWEQLELPYYSKGELLINLCNSAPLIKRKQFITIHDASVFAIPNTYSMRFRIWYQFLLKVTIRRSIKIITDSMFSKNELNKYCGKENDNIYQVPLGVDHIQSFESDENILSKWNLKRNQFILAVGSSSSNKNLESTIRAVDRLNLKDVFIVGAGGMNNRIFNKGIKRLNSYLHVGYVTDGELRALYENALCFVFPSFYEGFGLPPLEAMACGCPVIASQNASLPEVCGNGALYCDPNNIKDISEKISSVITNWELRSKLIERGLKHSKEFTWKKCCLNTFKIISEHFT